VACGKTKNLWAQSAGITRRRIANLCNAQIRMESPPADKRTLTATAPLSRRFTITIAHDLQ
jgi:hypothetical protein